MFIIRGQILSNKVSVIPTIRSINTLISSLVLLSLFEVKLVKLISILGHFTINCTALYICVSIVLSANHKYTIDEPVLLM